VIAIVRLGWATTVQDLGRAGLAHLGVPCSGAIDRDLAAVVNRAVGNPPDRALMETAGGLVVEARREVLVATSAHLAPMHLRPGDRLAVDPAHDRAWAYLAVRGGVVLDPVLGSRSQDTLSGLGPPRLREGDHLATGDAPCAPRPGRWEPR
jgi:allophanate hydrolase subunit 2